jgi:hypothetical protein
MPVCTEYSIYNGTDAIIQVIFTPCCGEIQVSPYGLSKGATLRICSSTYPSTITSPSITITTVGSCPSC